MVGLMLAFGGAPGSRLNVSVLAGTSGSLATLVIVNVSLAGNWNCWVVVIVTVPLKRCAPFVATMVRVGCGNDEVVSDC